MEKSQQQILQNIELMRDKQRLTRKQLADKINISEATYSRLMSEGIALSYDRLADIAKALEVSVIDVISYPDVFVNQKRTNTTKVLIELDVNDEEFVRLGLKDKVLQIFK